MSTYHPKSGDITRKWYVIDATDVVLGRLATHAADLLRGKGKPLFAPNVDCGDHVIIINCAQAVLTGNKLENKFYHHHSGFVGGLKSVQYKTLMAKNPTKAMDLAVGGMLPHNSIGRVAATRLRTYAGAEHDHAAQKPVVYEL